MLADKITGVARIPNSSQVCFISNQIGRVATHISIISNDDSLSVTLDSIYIYVLVYAQSHSYSSGRGHPLDDESNEATNNLRAACKNARPLFASRSKYEYLFEIIMWAPLTNVFWPEYILDFGVIWCSRGFGLKDELRRKVFRDCWELV